VRSKIKKIKKVKAESVEGKTWLVQYNEMVKYNFDGDIAWFAAIIPRQLSAPRLPVDGGNSMYHTVQKYSLGQEKEKMEHPENLNLMQEVIKTKWLIRTEANKVNHIQDASAKWYKITRAGGREQKRKKRGK